MTNPNLDYEIIVVSPFTLKEDRVVHLYEKKPSGTVSATNLAYRHSSAEYVAFWADDASPTTQCLSNMLSFVKNHKEPFIGAFRFRTKRGRELDQWSIYDKLYACFGCVSKNTVNLIGGLFDPIFKTFWADPDLSLRTWTRGGSVEICPDAWVVLEHIDDKVKNNNLSDYFKRDTEMFLNRWHDTMADGRKRSWTTVNKPICSPAKRLWIGLYAKLSSVALLRTIKQRVINAFFLSVHR